MKHHALLGLLFTALLCSLHAGQRPNIIVIYTDDHGWADLGAQGIQRDIKTPHLDALAAGGLRAVNGYITAPQCVPSRAGLLSGRYQNRFGLESNNEFKDPVAMGRFGALQILPERLKPAGYATGMAGKWHLGPDDRITEHGFDQVFYKHGDMPGFWNMDLAGKDIPPGKQTGAGYHLDLVADFASAFIRRHHAQPFFFYAAFRGPHTPLDAPEKYTARFPGEMPARRRQALAMMAAIDDGVGRIMATLREQGLEERTLLFFMGDNGAPLKITKTDSPLNGDAGGWDGSLNAPMNGEKGMLSEGGIRVPWLAYWKGTIPGGQVYEHPVISLDVAATALKVAGALAPDDSAKAEATLDGVNLLPYFKGENKAAPHDALYWRWIAQSAIREGNWKLLRGGEREYLYDLAADPGEKHNLAAQHPDIATRLRAKLKTWSATLTPPGLTTGPMAVTWTNYFDHYLEGKPISPPAASPGAKPKGKAKSAAAAPTVNQGWQARGGTLAEKDGILTLTPAQGKTAFITKSQLKVAAPATARLALKVTTAGAAAIAWRMEGEKDFLPASRATFQVTPSEDWQTHEVKLPAAGTLIHLRIHLPAGTTQLRDIELRKDTP